jgi:signal peptidase II
MRPLLAAPRDGRRERRASGIVRALRGSRCRTVKRLFAIALPLFALDQATKWWVIANIPPYSEPRVVIEDYFYLCHWQNTGAAFSVGTGRNWFFVALSIATLAGLLVFFARNAFRDVLSRTGVAMLIGGILGNLTDRLRFQHVVDFLLFDLHVRFANPWPAFNVADSCIFVATFLFVIATIRDARKPRAEVAT